MNNPKISVIIPLYNHEKYIQEAICSVLEQSIPDFELIIINDGSSDKSEEIVKAMKDDRIRYIYQENQGAHNTINRGIQNARGEYVSILNSDDIYYMNRFEEALKILESDSSGYAVFSHIEFIDGDGNFIRFMKGAEDNWNNKNEETTFKGKNDIVIDLLAGNFLMTTSNLFCRKEVFNKIGYFANLRYAHDYDFFLRLCSYYKTHVIDIPLLKYRFHGANTITENKAEANFEIGLILTNYFLNYDLKNIYEDEKEKYDMMTRLFNSINTYNTDRMIMVLLTSAIKYKENGEEFMKTLTEHVENPFRMACVDKFKNHIDLWQHSQEGWRRWTENEKELEILKGMLNSYSYRLGRTLTWPLRKLLGKE